MKIKVEENNIRLDKFLSEKTDYSRSLISKMLKSNYIFVNGKLEKPSYLVQENDVIDIKDGFVKEVTLEKNKMDLDIVYEDNDIIIVNKPSGLVVHPGCGNYNNTLVNGLTYYTNELSNGSNESRPGIVHRIDKDTSGLLIVAKTNKAEEILGKCFKEHSINRTYIALVEGVIKENKIVIDAPIGRDISSRKQMMVTSKNSKKAITHLEVLKRYKNYTLVKLILETGRTHQIRVHLNYIGHPLVNDPVYGKRKLIDESGQCLHAKELGFIHPTTKEEMYFTSELPECMTNIIDIFEKE